MRRRLTAFVTLLLGVSSLALGAVAVSSHFPVGLLGPVLLVVAARSAWQGLVQRGGRRVLNLCVSGLFAGAFLFLVFVGRPVLVLAAFACLATALISGRTTFRIRVNLPRAPRPAHSVLFWNPRSGGGKAQRFRLADEARARGITPVELGPGDDLEQLVLRAIEGGADALAMAGGDGSQAVVARIAAERGLPYACIPAGTRNHFALDLGVDRDDVVGALDAFVDGSERIVDLADVNGFTFVNNVSLGLYGAAVQQERYRNAKVRTLLETVPEIAGPGVEPRLSWQGPDGERHQGAAALVVSNDPYRLGNTLFAGTRPRLDTGLLGIAVLNPPPERPQSWTTPTFEVDATFAVAAGIDGEARMLKPPLHFRIRPAVLRCRIARRHPGASPSAFEPEGAAQAVRALAAIAFSPRGVR